MSFASRVQSCLVVQVVVHSASATRVQSSGRALPLVVVWVLLWGHSSIVRCCWIDCFRSLVQAVTIASQGCSFATVDDRGVEKK